MAGRETINGSGRGDSSSTSRFASCNMEFNLDMDLVCRLDWSTLPQFGMKAPLRIAAIASFEELGVATESNEIFQFAVGRNHRPQFDFPLGFATKSILRIFWGGPCCRGSVLCRPVVWGRAKWPSRCRQLARPQREHDAAGDHERDGDPLNHSNSLDIGRQGVRMIGDRIPGCSTGPASAQLGK